MTQHFLCEALMKFTRLRLISPWAWSILKRTSYLVSKNGQDVYRLCVHGIFKAKPLVAFRRSNNLSNLLVSAKLRKLATITNQPRGSFRCGKNCLTCNYINDGLTNYTFNSTGETRLINHYIDCNSKNVIYMVQCNNCHKQYIGETKRRLKGVRREIFLVASRYGNRDKLRPDGSLGSYADFTLNYWRAIPYLAHSYRSF